MRYDRKLLGKLCPCAWETIKEFFDACLTEGTIPFQNTYLAEAAIACVNEDICSGCGIYKTVFSYNTIEIVTEREKRKAQENDVLCRRSSINVGPLDPGKGY